MIQESLHSRRLRIKTSSVPVPGFIRKFRNPARRAGRFLNHVFGPDPKWASQATRRERIAHAMGFAALPVGSAYYFSRTGSPAPIPGPQNYVIPTSNPSAY